MIRLLTGLIILVAFYGCLPQPSEITGEFAGVGSDVEQVIKLSLKDAPPIETFSQRIIGDAELPIFFGRLTQIEPLEEGGFFIFDAAQFHILYFNGNGNFVESFGREGEGPGEFSQAVTLKTFDEKLYVLDRLAYKIDVFTQSDGNWQFEYSYPIENINDDRPDTFVKVDEESFWIRYRHTRTHIGKSYSVSHLVRIFKDSSTPPQTWIVEYPPINLFFEDLGGFWASYPGPFTPLPVVAITSDSDIITARTDEYRFLRSNDAGNELHVSEMEVDSLTLTEEQKQNVSGFAERIMDMVQENMPESRPPVYNRLLPDNNNGFWAGYFDETQNEQVWMLIGETGTTETTINLDPNISIINYNNRAFYGFITNEEGLQEIVVIEI